MKAIGAVGYGSKKILYIRERVGDAWVFRIVKFPTTTIKPAA